MLSVNVFKIKYLYKNANDRNRKQTLYENLNAVSAECHA